MARIFNNVLHTAGALLFPALINAQVDRTQAPTPGPAPTVNVGEHKSFTLANGMRVILVENHKLPMVSIQVKFDIEPILQGELAGYQDLMGELLASGTSRHTKEQIDELVDGMGASLSTASDGLYATVLAKNFPQMMGLVYEIITSATFPSEEFEKARTRMLSSVRTRTDDPDQIAETVSQALIYGKSHPYGEVTTEASLAKITRSNVFAYYQRYFHPALCHLVFVGDITEVQARGVAERYFASWGPAPVKVTKENGVEVIEGLGPARPATFTPAANKPRTVCFVDRPGSAQSVIKVCYPVDVKPGDPGALSGQVMNTILGGGVFNARLMQNLREDKAYTYGAYSSLEPDRYIGNWSGGCSVRNDVTDSAITQILYEMMRISEEPVTDEELALTKSFMAGSFGRGLEDPRTVARFALNIDLYNLKPDHYSGYLQRLDTVSRSSVQSAAQRFLFPENAMILVVGDKAQVANTLARQSLENTVLYFDINGDPYRETAEMAPADMTADQVVENHLTAIGGRPAIEKVKDVRKEYAATVQGMEVVLLEQQLVPDQYAMEMKMGPMVLQKLVYNTGAGFIDGPDGRRELMDQELADARESAAPFAEANYKAMGHQLTLTGVVEVEGRKAYRVKVLTMSDKLFTEYFDVESGLKVRRVETQVTPQGTLEVTTDYSDYRAISGLKFPYVIKQNAGMNMVFQARVIDVNKGIDKGAFNTN